MVIDKSKLIMAGIGIIATSLLIWLVMYLCSWTTEYGPVRDTQGIVKDKYHRRAYTTRSGKTTHYHPAVWRVTINCYALNTEMQLRGSEHYNAVSEGDRLHILYKEYWKVRYRDNKEIDRKWGGYEIVSYSKE